MSSLYQLSQDLVALDQLLQEIGGDVSEGTQGETLEKWMKEFKWQQREKVDGYCGLIANMESDISAISDEAKRLQDRARFISNRIDRLKAMAKFSMETLGVRKLEGQKFTLSIQKNGGKDPIELLIEDVSKFPDRFVKIIRSPDKEALRNGLEGNDPEALKFARIGERGESLRVR